MRHGSVGSLVLLIAGATLAVGCGPRNVSFAKEVQPILAKNCSECHVQGQPGYVASGLDTTSHAALMKGGKYGALVKPGDAFTSALFDLGSARTFGRALVLNLPDGWPACSLDFHDLSSAP